MEIALIGLSVASSLMQAQAQDAQTAAQIQSLQAQQQADLYNQRIAEQNAQITGQQTQAQLDLQDRERRLRAGSARAAGGASGVGLESFGDILQSSAAQEELDLLTIKSEGLLRQRDYLNQSNLLGMSADAATNQISLTKKAGKASKAAAILGSFSKGLNMANNGGGI